jgi:hypothetical protein
MIQHYNRPHSMADDDATATTQPEPHACPACGRVDAIMKASSIARANRGRMVLDDGSCAAYESELGSMLGRPARPEVLPIGVIVSAVLTGWLLLALDLAVVAGIRAQSAVSIPNAALEVATYLGIAWFGLLIPGSGILRYFASRERVNQELPAWREAAQRWQSFHYCSRDDLVYVPGEGQGVAPEHIELLYRKIQQPQVVALKPREAQA